MKAKELIAFLQQYPEADVVVLPPEGGSMQLSTMEYVAPEKLAGEVDKKHYPDGAVFLSENNIF